MSRFAIASILLLVLVSIGMTPGCTRMTMLDLEFENTDNWLVFETEHFVFHYRSGTSGASDIEEIAVSQEAVLRRVEDSLGVEYPGVVHYYLYEHSETEFTLSSSKDGGHIDPVHNSIYIGYSGGVLYTSDLIKLIAENLFGHAGSDLMYEGFSHGLLSEYRGAELKKMISSFKENYFTILDLEKMLKDRDRYDNIQVDHFSMNYWKWVYLSENIDIYSPQCGYFVRYLIDRFGMAIVAELYNVPADSFEDNLEKICGIPAATIEAEYLELINGGSQ